MTWPSKVAAIAGVYAVLVGSVVLVGSCLRIEALVRPLPQLPRMVPSTAEGLALLGGALLLLRTPTVTAARRRLGQTLSLVAFALAVATLVEYLTGLTFWIDRGVCGLPLTGWAAFTGRTAPGAAIAIALLGMGLATIDTAPAVRADLSEVAAFGAALVAMLTLSGYAYGATSLYSAPRPHAGMAPHTTLTLLVLGAGLICARSDRLVMALVTSAHAGGFVVRRLLAGVVLLPIVGLLVMVGRRTLYGEPFAEALLAAAGAAVAAGLLFSTGLALDRADAARDATQRALAEREERLRELMDHASDGIFITDLDGRYLEVNDAGCEMLGYRRDQLVGRTITDLLPADERPRLAAAKAALLQGDTIIDEWTLTRADGTSLPVEVSSKILRDGRWQGIVRDISARQDLERASETVATALTGDPQSSVQSVLETIALEAQAATGAEFAAIGLDGARERPFDPWVVVGLPPGTAATPAPRAVGLLGFVATRRYPVRVTDIRRHPAFLGWPAHHPDTRSFLGVAIRSRGRVIGELYLANKRGAAEFTVADERAIERLAGRAGTIIQTARLYQAEGLERSWLQAVIDQMPEGVILTDATGAVHLTNRSMQGFTQQRGYGLCLPNGQPLPLEDQPMIRALVEGMTTEHRELAARHVDGRLIPMLVSAAPVFDDKDRPYGVVTIFQDISTIKELERLREEWASVVAHDLRQPVNVITLDAESLARLLAGGDFRDWPKVLNRIRQSTRRLNTMIDDLLDVSLIEARRLHLEREDADLAVLLDAAVYRLAPLAPGHRVRLSIGVASAPVFADAARIEQVLSNLISNAAKYGEAGADIGIVLAQTGAEFEVAVISRGPGIATADLPRVFQRFARSQPRRGGAPGLGLGLYICKGLVEAHGGRIWVESAPGETTAFRFTIPQRARALPQAVFLESTSSQTAQPT